MMRMIIFLFFISSKLAFAEAFLTPEKVLPEKVLSLLGQKESEIQKNFGKPTLSKFNQSLYEIDGYRFRLIINTDQEKITQVRYVTVTGPSLQEFIGKDDPESMKITPSPEQGHNSARYLKLELKTSKGDWELYFHNNAHRKLHSLVWKES